ncbi:MAG: hypothetical protein JW839_00330, partial [Candidatus Lokiarchaeota archaeon]|nr:hypothetical protein [Candidatus Lokiarchaeota archaeon]
AVQQRFEGTRTCVDFDQNGLPDYTIDESSMWTSEPFTTRWLVNWTTGSGWVEHEWRYRGPTVHSVAEEVDYNMDGFTDLVATHVDEWDDPVTADVRDESDPRLDHVSNSYDENRVRTFETHYYTRRWLESDPVTGQYVATESWTDVDIMANRSFYLVDYDGYHLFEDVPCIIFEDVRVPFSPVTSLPEGLWVDPHGSLYFVDDGSGRHGMAIVFSEDSYENFVDGERVPVAIGVAFDYDADNKISTDYAYYNEIPGHLRMFWEKPKDAGTGFRDSFFPLDWMAPGNTVAFTDLIYEEAWREFQQQLEDPLYWVMQAMSTAVNIAILCLTTYLKNYIHEAATLVGMYLHYIWGQYSVTIQEELDRLREPLKRKGLDRLRDDSDLEAPWWIGDLSNVGLGRLLRVYPYAYTRVDVVGSTTPRAEDPVQNEPDVFAIPVEVPTFRPVRDDRIFNIAVYDVPWGAERDDIYGRNSPGDMHEWHDVFRGNGTTSKEVTLSAHTDNVFFFDVGWLGSWEVESFFDASQLGTYGFGDSYEFHIDISFAPSPLGWLFITGTRVLPFVGWLEFTGQTLIPPLAIAVGSFAGGMPGLDGKLHTSLVLTGTIAKQDGTFTVDDSDTTRPLPRFYYNDTTVMGRAEDLVRKASRGRLGTVVPLVDNRGRFSYIAIPASGMVPDFYRESATAPVPLRDGDGRATYSSTDQPCPYDLLYQVDYGITALMSHHHNALTTASKGGLFSIFMGGDWRIWLTNIAIQAVDTIIVVLVSKCIINAGGLVKDSVTGEAIKGTTGFGNLVTGFTEAGKAIVGWSLKQAVVAVLKDCIKEICEEIFQEQLVSESLRLLGLPDELCETAGEYAWYGMEMREGTQEQRERRSNMVLAIAARVGVASQRSLDVVARAEAELRGELARKAGDAAEAARIGAALRTLRSLRSEVKNAEAMARADRIAAAQANGDRRRADRLMAAEEHDFAGSTAAQQYEQLGDIEADSVVSRSILHANLAHLRGALQACLAAIEVGAPAGVVAALFDLRRTDVALNAPELLRALGVPEGSEQQLEVIDELGMPWTWAEILAEYPIVDEALLEFLKNARKITSIDPKKDSMIEDGEPTHNVHRVSTAWADVSKNRFYQTVDEFIRDRLNQQIKRNGKSTEGIVEHWRLANDIKFDYKDAIVDMMIQGGYLQNLRDPAKFASVQDKHISEEVQGRQVERSRALAISDRLAMREAIEIYQLFSSLNTLMRNVKGFSWQLNFLKTFEEITRIVGKSKSSTLSAFQSIDTQSPVLTMDLKVWILAVVCSARSLASLNQVKNVLIDAIDRLDSAIKSGEKIKPTGVFTAEQKRLMRSFFTIGPCIESGLMEAMWWIFAVEFGGDQLGIKEGDQLGRSMSTLPGRESEAGKNQMLKPDMGIFRDIKFKGKENPIKKLRGILDMTAMPLPSIGYSDSYEGYITDG